MAEAECTVCAEGTYCPSPGLQATTQCPAGSFCPVGTSEPLLCPNGTYGKVPSVYAGQFSPVVGLVDAAQCQPCPESLFCTGGTIVGECAAGHMCFFGNDRPDPQMDCDCEPDHTGALICPENCRGMLCPRGVFCPAGTIEPENCGEGLVRFEKGGKMAADCTPCPAGVICLEGDPIPRPCPAGRYCPGIQMGDNRTTEMCPSGTYCPGNAAVEFPIVCPAGTYQDEPAQDRCKDTPAGYWTEEKSTDYLNNTCPEGYYCPVNTEYALQHACPPGTYSTRPLLTTVTACLSCPPGKYCGGLAEPTFSGPCEAGFFCSGGAAESTPAKSSGWPQTSGPCPAGSYCVGGSFAPTPCTAGRYCDREGLAEPTGLCMAGYFCGVGESVANPNRCPPGHFCVEGTSVPVPCPPGTYSAAEGNANVTNCRPCSGGQNCLDSGLSAPSGLCDAGYYCPHDVATVYPNPQAYPCLAGHRCLEGIADPIPCEPGTYQPNTGQDACLPTPERYFSADGENLVLCEPGHYCPEGSPSPTHFPCPRGTWNNGTGLSSADECTLCPNGYYCATDGLDAPSGPCSAGHFCRLGATTPSPEGTEDVEVLWLNNVLPSPADHSCLHRDAAPSEYTEGAMQLGNLLEEHRDSSSGLYGCEVSGVHDLGPVGSWDITIQSLPGSDQPAFAAVVLEMAGMRIGTTPIEFYNEEHTAHEVSVVGHTLEYTFRMSTNATQRSSHPVILKGRASLSTGDVCPLGHYCPSGCAEPVSCPVGTFANETGLSACHRCLAGRFCGDVQMTAPGQLCQKGYYCLAGAAVANPSAEDGVGGPCTNGTFSDTPGATSADFCVPCTAGYTCPVAASNATKVRCPAGAFCPSGSSEPLRCNNGTYRNSLGGVAESDCSTCPAGYRCPLGSTNPERCPQGTCAFLPLCVHCSALRRC